MKFSAAALAVMAGSSHALGKGGLRQTTERHLYPEAGDGIIPYNESCTALVGVGIDPADPLGDDQTFLACMTPDGVINRFKGICKDWIFAYYTKELLTSSITGVEMENAELDCATDEIIVDVFPPAFTPGSGTPLPRHNGTRTVLAIRVVANGQEPTVTAADISDSLFGTGGNPRTLQSQFAACSQGNLDLQPAEGAALLGGFVPAGDAGRRMAADEYDEDYEEDDAHRGRMVYQRDDESSVSVQSNRRLETDASDSPRTTRLSQYILVGTGDGASFTSVKLGCVDLGADISVLSSLDQDENIQLDLSSIFVNGTGNYWMKTDYRAKKKPDFLPGASRLHETVTWTGDFALTGDDAKYETYASEIYGHKGVITADRRPSALHTHSKFYPYGVGNGIKHDYKGSKDLYRAIDAGERREMARLRQELRDVEDWVTDLAPEVTLKMGDAGFTGYGIENVDLVEMNVDMYDTNGDGIAVIDIDFEDNDFVLRNTNWIIESENKTFTVIRLLGNTNLKVDHATIMTGDGIDNNALKTDALYNGTISPPYSHNCRVMFVKAHKYRSAPASVSNSTNMGARRNSQRAVFDMNDVVLNGVGFYDLVAFYGNETSDPNDEGRTKISVNNGQGCTQFVAPKIELDSSRFVLCGSGKGFGKKSWGSPGCKARGVGTEKAWEGEPFGGCPAEAFRCTVDGATDGEFALPSQLAQENRSAVEISCVLQNYTGNDDPGPTVKIEATTQFVDHWFQFEMMDKDYFIAKASLGYLGDQTTNVHYENKDRFVSEFGGVVKTGVLMTKFRRRRGYSDVERVDMCVIPREKACEKEGAQNPTDPGDTSGGGTNTGPSEITDGVLTITIPENATDAESFIVNEITEQLTNHFGKKPWELADYIMYCLPEGAMSRTSYGYVNSWLSVYSDTACTNLPIQMRELGHNMGMGPSYVAPDGPSFTWGTERDEWDTSGVMGGANFDPSKGSVCFNSAKLHQMGWYDAEEYIFTTNSAPETLDLTGFIQPEAPGQIKIVKLARNSPFDYYLACNWQSGDNADTELGANSVTVVGQGNDGGAFSRSWFGASLAAGETFFYAGYFDGVCDLNVTVNEVNAETGVCDVTITACYENMPTPAPTPSPTGPTPIPTDAPTYSPTTECVPLDGICETEDDCCNDGGGVCVLDNPAEGFSTKIICVATPDAVVDPSAFPGTCDDNGVCEAGENCYSCPRDCNGLLSGERDERYCCDGNLAKGATGAPVSKFSLRPDDPKCLC